MSFPLRILLIGLGLRCPHMHEHTFLHVFIIQLLIIEVLDITRYPSENTHIDRGDSRSQYWYSVVDISIISNISLVNNSCII